ncbi:MAG: DUF167 domain-containing protein [archaeon]|jgi:uncharacterized protein (TIGR00251 family)
MFTKSQIVNLQVICNTDKQELQKIDDNTYKLKIRSQALKGKANKEIFEFFKEKGYNIEIVKGEKSNKKLIKIL